MSLHEGGLASPRLLGRHQIAALLGTTADFASMVALVELGGLTPPVATMLSAAVGGTSNFALSRMWVFRWELEGSLGSQALRYGLASLGGALLNALVLMLVLRTDAAVPYPLARAAVAATISLLYTYPVHASFVFRAER